MFADITKMHRQRRGVEDKDGMQSDLDSDQRRAEKYLLRFNVSKRKKMHMGWGNQGILYNLQGWEYPSWQGRNRSEYELTENESLADSVQTR